MRIRLIFNDKDYCRAFRNAITSADKDVYVEIGQKGVIKELGSKTILVTDVKPEQVDKRLVGRTVFLTLNPTDEIDIKKRDEVFKVFKYSPSSKILSDIEEVNYLLTGDSGINYSVNSRIYAVCSDSIPNNFQIAQTLARQILFRHGGKILILSLKYINEYAEQSTNDNSKFTKLMYYLNSNRDCSIEPYIYQDSYGISFLRLANGINPISRLEESEVITLIRSLCNREFQTVILDIGECYSNINIKLLCKADNIVFFSCEASRNFDIESLYPDVESKNKINKILINNTYQDLELEIDDYVKGIYGG